MSDNVLTRTLNLFTGDSRSAELAPIPQLTPRQETLIRVEDLDGSLEMVSKIIAAMLVAQPARQERSLEFGIKTDYLRGVVDSNHDTDLGAAVAGTDVMDLYSEPGENLKVITQLADEMKNDPIGVDVAGSGLPSADDARETIARIHDGSMIAADEQFALAA